uniref:Uncharacterized protein n=1 Tax=Lepeophtheirus salmonis TaxID=72036 RepID=A0A0K2U9M0_LEPSM
MFFYYKILIQKNQFAINRQTKKLISSLDMRKIDYNNASLLKNNSKLECLQEY